MVFPGGNPDAPEALQYREEVARINAHRRRLIIFEDYVRAATSFTFSASVAGIIAYSSRWLIRKLR